MSTATSTSRITEGDVAPDFELPRHDGELWGLSDHLDRPGVLLFFPGAFTSVCTTELRTVTDDLNSFDQTHVVGISTDSVPVLEKYRSENDFDFPLLSDHDAEVCDKYGAKYDEDFGPLNLDRIAKRAAFVIDRNRVVRYAEVLNDAGKQPSYDDIENVLTSIREA